MAGLFIGLLCATLLLIFDTRTMVSGALVFAAVVSPPILLLVERGNIDALMFAGLVIPIYIMAKRTSAGTTLVQCGLIAFLTVLKIYPIAAVVVLARRRFGYRAMALTIALAVVGLLGVIGPAELKTIAINTPQSVAGSYGDLPMFIVAYNHGLLPAAFDGDKLRLIAGVTAIVLAGAALAFSLLFPRIPRTFLPSLNPTTGTGAAAISCLAVFCFSFLLGTNFDYRLVFLLGVLPPVLIAYDEEQRSTTLSIAGLIVSLLWISRVSWHIPVWFEIMDWSLFVAGIMWLTQAIFFLPSAVNAK